MKSLVDKTFLIDEEEWVVEEVLLYDKRCRCRSYYSDRTELFFCDYVKNKVASYNKDMKELNKNRNAIIIREDNEKSLLFKIINKFCETTTLNELTESEIEALLTLKKML